MKAPSPIVVFVHFGANPTPLLLQNAYVAKSELPNSTLVLITTHPERWGCFPGRLINYSESDRNPSILRLVKRFPELEEISRGYWVYTLERIFALSILLRYFGRETPCLHIESDNFSLVDQTIFNVLIKNSYKVSVPRYSEEKGIASLLFSPTLDLFDSTILEFEGIVNHSKDFIGDMDLLGRALDQGIVSELPTTCSSAWTIDDASGCPAEKVIFDGAAIGQYLLGQDPLHTNGFAIPGHINEHFPDPITDWKWEIFEKSDKRGALRISYNGEVFRIANIHLHSKIEMPAVNTLDTSWRTVIDGANGLIPRLPQSRPPDDIHTRPISLRNRIRLARRNGLLHLMKTVCIRTVKHFHRS